MSWNGFTLTPEDNKPSVEPKRLTPEDLENVLDGFQTNYPEYETAVRNHIAALEAELGVWKLRTRSAPEVDIARIKTLEDALKSLPCTVIHQGYPKGATCLDCRHMVLSGDSPATPDWIETNRCNPRRVLCDACFAKQALAAKEPRIERHTKAPHLGNGALTRDLWWCECGRGLGENINLLDIHKRFRYCPSCGAKQDWVSVGLGDIAAKEPKA